MANTRSDAIVLFGASGDLAKKMTFVSLYHLAERGKLDMPIVGVAFSNWNDDSLRKNAKADIEKVLGKKVKASVWNAMAKRMTYVQGDYTKPDTYERLKTALGGAKRPLFYLEIPPSLFEVTVQGLYDSGLSKNARVVVEKPFGYDLASARKLNANLSKMITQDQLYRIDHYLGKSAVENIMVFRFANRLIEPLWRGEHIKSVMITMSESFGVADRGSFYDAVGALKDVVQNHIMQITGLLAMEPPTKATPEAIHIEQTKVFDAMRPLTKANYVRGQYDGYLKVKGVKKTSKTETYSAMRIDIDSWRWAGVPLFIRAGKSMATTATEVVVQLKRPPLALFDQAGCAHPEHNLIRLQIGPTPGVRLRLQAKDPDGGMTSQAFILESDFEEQLGAAPLPYELLLDDALSGDHTLFATQEMIEGTWKVLAPVLKDPGPVYKYKVGTMGPKQADSLVKGYGGWVDPIARSSDSPA